MRRILFVCTGNTCRSVLAEYLGRRFCGQVFSFESAGIRPQRSQEAENAVLILRSTFGIDASAHEPRDVRKLDLNSFDLVIAIEKNAAAVVRELGVPDSKLQVWPIHDPWGGDLTEYEQTALDIRKRLAQLKKAAQERI
jgi:protein-tyrosine-phosphatase